MAQPGSHNYTVHCSTLPDSGMPVSQSCNLPPDLTISALEPYFATPMNLSHQEKAAKALIHGFAPEYPIAKIRAIPSSGIQQLYGVELTGGGVVMFTLPPQSGVTPLRNEIGNIAAEASLLQWLSGLPPQGLDHISNDNGEDKDNDGSECSVIELPAAKNYLHGYLPTLIKHGLRRPEVRAPEFMLSYPCPGLTISSLSQPLTDRARASAQYQAGQLFRRVSCHLSPTGSYGDVADVLRRHPTLPRPSCRGEPSDTGYDTWSEAFHLMMESMMRDLEDRLVQVGYARVRRHFDRLRHLLDRVTRPALVAIQGSEDANILVSLSGETNGLRLFPGSDASSIEDSTNDDGESRKCGIKVHGLRDWSNCIFGDPLIATTFIDLAPAAFISGLNTPFSNDDPFQGSSVIEDPERAPCRILLYNCYHALRGLANEYYHKRHGDDELAYRKQLITASVRLDDFGDDGNLLH